ncbi:hypothetical protein MAR_001302 [Mya arenaria]|uniref:Tc1-like transposase DDE domain-containing protein n=1 Tax=Mya arenaria TaxID=6604 RepID=A0ABY7FE64_MYAAR|nr:hypothetical protein MAR_001302 [Mya arenaria]
MRDNGIHWLDDWPSESPDLNPIEMLWANLKTHMYRRACTTVYELVAAITKYWKSKVTAEKCNRYIDYVFKVAPVCVVMKGYATGDVPKKIFQ